MAKNSQGKGTGTSRVRFTMVEAEMADGDISQITQAIQNALRGPTPSSPRIAAQPTRVIAHEEEAPEDLAEGSEVEDEEATDVSSKTLRARGSRKAAPTPDVLERDFVTEPSLAGFAQKTNPKSDRKRFLVIAAWFKEHRSLPAITVGHVYTAYRTLKWPTNISDFSQPLRTLKSLQFFTSPEKGQYAINHLGLQEVDNLLTGGGE